MKRNDVAIFILSHGRAEKQDTLFTLKRMGCKIPIYIMVDDMDEQLDVYKSRFDNVVVFDKRKIVCDTMNNKEIWSSCLYARVFANQLAREKNIKYYIMADDDISDLKIRALKGDKLKAFDIKSIDDVFYAMCDYMESASKLEMIGFAQSGAYIGGANGVWRDKVKRYVSQVFMCRTDYNTRFRGVMCQDFLGSVDCGLKGNVALTSFLVSIASPKRMSNKGGMFDAYKNTDVYGRDFYICMAYPSTGKFGDSFTFQKQTNFIFPRILNQNCKK